MISLTSTCGVREQYDKKTLEGRNGKRPGRRRNGHDFTYMWNLNETNEQTKQKQTHSYREQANGCQRGGKSRDGRNF